MRASLLKILGDRSTVTKCNFYGATHKNSTISTIDFPPISAWIYDLNCSLFKSQKKVLWLGLPSYIKCLTALRLAMSSKGN